MKLLKEFKEFAVKGNVVDLAVAVVIGGAFGKIVSSLVADIVMPLISLLIGGINFSDLKIKLTNLTSINIGNFIQTVIDFLIIAFSIFMVIKIITQAKKKISILEKKDEKPAEPEPEPEPSPEVVLLTEIRDALKK
jgi:large conductance mechanosensitive channel